MLFSIIWDLSQILRLSPLIHGNQSFLTCVSLSKATAISIKPGSQFIPKFIPFFHLLHTPSTPYIAHHPPSTPSFHCTASSCLLFLSSSFALLFPCPQHRVHTCKLFSMVQAFQVIISIIFTLFWVLRLWHTCRKIRPYWVASPHFPTDSKSTWHSSRCINHAGSFTISAPPSIYVWPGYLFAYRYQSRMRRMPIRLANRIRRLQCFVYIHTHDAPISMSSCSLWTEY